MSRRSGFLFINDFFRSKSGVTVAKGLIPIKRKPRLVTITEKEKEVKKDRAIVDQTNFAH